MHSVFSHRKNNTELFQIANRIRRIESKAFHLQRMEHGFVIPNATRVVAVKDLGGNYEEITPDFYNVMKNDEHREWLQVEALEEFIQLDWTTPRYSLANIVEMSRTWDSHKKCCTVGGRIVDLGLDALSSIFRLQGYGKKPRRLVKNWVSQFFDKAALRRSGYLTSACQSSIVRHRIKFVTLTLHVNWIRSEAPLSIVQAVELPGSRNPGKKDWLGMMAHAFWKAMDKSQEFSAVTYVQVLLKAHLRIILDYVLRPDAVMPKSIRTRLRTAVLTRQAIKMKKILIIQRARMKKPKLFPRTRCALVNTNQAGKSKTPDPKKILGPVTALIEASGKAQTRSGAPQSSQLILMPKKEVEERDEEDGSTLRTKQCNETETGEKEESNGNQLEEGDAHKSHSGIYLTEELFDQYWGYGDGTSDTSNEEGTVQGPVVETEREAEKTHRGATKLGPDSPQETETQEMNVDPTANTVDGVKKSSEFSAFAEPLMGRMSEVLLGMFQEGWRQVNPETNEWDSERIKSQNRLETLQEENHKLQQQVNSYRLQEIQDQKNRAEEESAWKVEHESVLKLLAAKIKDVLALENGATDMKVELNRVREQRAKWLKELTFYVLEKDRLEKEAEDLNAKRVEQEKRIKVLEERVEKAESDLETSTVSLKTSQKEVNERNKSVARANKVVKGLQGRIEKMPSELRKLYNLNLVPESQGSKKRKTAH